MTQPSKKEEKSDSSFGGNLLRENCTSTNHEHKTSVKISRWSFNFGRFLS